MNHNITLTIEEIHAIREEHSAYTKNLPNDEYYKYLEKEASPIRLALECAKSQYMATDKI